MNYNEEIEKIEIQLLLEGVYRLYGYDFREYAYSSLKRRIWYSIQAEKLHTISEFQARVLHDRVCMERFLLNISINVTAMFRDPEFYIAFREKMVPFLSTLPFIRIWHVGCSTGEEVYSMAILLKEEDLYEKSRIYATDFNEKALKMALDGIFRLELMKEYTENYIKAGGKRAFSEYYTADNKNAVFSLNLKENIVWAQHNLTTDTSFNEFNVIICRNVMIYFNKSLQNRVHKMLYESLAKNGCIGLGTAENIKFTPYENCYEDLDRRMKLYKRIK